MTKSSLQHTVDMRNSRNDNTNTYNWAQRTSIDNSVQEEVKVVKKKKKQFNQISRRASKNIGKELMDEIMKFQPKDQKILQSIAPYFTLKPDENVVNSPRKVNKNNRRI